jgi:mannose-1-phosphate guanylyltransferase
LITPVVLCGGSGTRLWPLSRLKHPKQFHPVFGDSSLLEDTVNRLQQLENSGLLAICNDEYRFIAAEQIRNTGTNLDAMILEPEGRNTAPAIAVAAQHVLANKLPPVMLVLPSDHLIHNTVAFTEAVNLGSELALHQPITFGVMPDRPETGYGYIQTGESIKDGVKQVSRFVEKPDIEKAKEFLESGDFLWNSGMFMFHAGQYLELLAEYESDVFQRSSEAYDKSRRDGAFIFLDAEAFNHCPSTSIDYAVMERVNRSAVVTLDADWFDVGSWKGVLDAADCDNNGNSITGNVRSYNSSHSVLRSDGRLLVVNDLHNMVVVDTEDATFISSLDKSQDVKEIVADLVENKLGEVEYHRRVLRPWGAFEGVDKGPGFQVKRLSIHPHSEISLQYHHHRAEHWVVVRGIATVQKDEDILRLNPSESIYIPQGTIHKLSNLQDELLEIIEVQTGDYLGEDDIVRLEDRYGRELEVVS